jgi:two-component system chemotaxis response regulator CheB
MDWDPGRTVGAGPDARESMEDKIKVLIVDDAAFMRKAVKELLSTDKQFEVVGTARDGLDGLDKIKALKPDVVTLDIDMPVMDGLSAIRHIMLEAPCPIVVLSSMFSDGAVTFEALRLGVVDFVPKPSGAISTDIGQSRQQIIDRIKISRHVNLENISRVRLMSWNAKAHLEDRYRYRPLDYIVAVGTTVSGPNTVIRLLSKLTPTLPAAVVVVQEIAPKILPAFVQQFDSHVPWKIEMAREGVPLEQGTCYISSTEAGFGLAIDPQGRTELRPNIAGEEPLNYLFATAADTFHQNAIGVLLTGIGRDGAEGLERIQKASGVTMAQDTVCCVYPNLTDNAITRGVVDVVLNEKQLPGAIETMIH